MNIVEDDLPRGDVATVRQVLQHLSNTQIGAALPKLARYKHVIVTEHVPRGSFRPNVNKAMGPELDLRRPLASFLELARSICRSLYFGFCAG